MAAMKSSVPIKNIINPIHRAIVFEPIRGLAMALVAFAGFFLMPSSLRGDKPITGAIFTTDSTCTEVNVNIYDHKADVYIDGGPDHPGSAGLPDGSYCVQVTDPSGQTVLGLSDPAAVTVVEGEFVECYQLTAILKTGSSGFTVPGFDDTPNPGGEYKVWVSTDCEFANNTSKTDNFQVQEECTKSSLSVTSFYDANANGVKDLGEEHMLGWMFRAFSHDNLQIVKETPKYIHVLHGTYTAIAGLPIEQNWVHTSPVKIEFTTEHSDEDYVTYVTWGNVCLGSGGANTSAFWNTKAGQAMTTAADLASLSGMYLRNARGADFNPATIKALSSWQLNAGTINMAYMLSAQLATMQLNVWHSFVNGGALVHAPGLSTWAVGGLNSFGFITVNDLMAAAAAEIQAHGMVDANSPYRAYQEALKTALDDANNNRTFTQGAPCAATFDE